MNTKLLSAIGLVAIVVLFFGINIFVGAAVRTARLDLTEDALYTLPAGAKKIARQIDEPIRIRYYFSRDLASGMPNIISHAQRVEDTLREFAAASNGKIELEIINPEPSSEAEDEAMAAGIAGQRVSMAGDMLYFGLIATNAIDGREVVPFFDPTDERLLIYDLARRLHVLSHPDRPRVAVMSGLPIQGAPANQFTGEPAQPAWHIIESLRAIYEVQFVPTDGTRIGEDVGLLLVVFPKAFSPRAWYAIDQFIMRGGHAIFALDPHCVNYLPPEAQQNQAAIYTADRSAGMGPLAKAWGVDIAPEVVAGDQLLAMSGPAQDGSGRVVSYPVFLEMTEDHLADGDPITAALRLATIYAGGVLEVADTSTLIASPLLTTSAESMRFPVASVRIPDPERLTRDFVVSGEELTIAARLTGPLASAFPGGLPDPTRPDAPPHIAQTSAPAEIIVLTDVDMLSDGAWLRPLQFGSQVLGYQPIADNGSLVLNAAENLLGSSDLTSIRASAASVRPFTRVEEIRRAAETKFAAERDEIASERAEVAERINALLRGQTDDEILLTADMQAEIDRLKETDLELRKRARAAQYNLTADVDRLDMQMRLINIALVPAAVTVFAIGLAVYRGVRRRADQSRQRGVTA